MRNDPPAARARWRREEALEAPVLLDQLVRELMADRRARLAAEDVDQEAEEDADAPPEPVGPRDAG